MRILRGFFSSQIILIALIFPLLVIGCRKDVTEDVDITKSRWNLKSVSTGNETFTPNQVPDLDDDSYILFFENDSVFKLNTSVNRLGGGYNIPGKGKFSIKEPIGGTKIGVTGEAKIVDDNLVEVFRESTTYEVLGNYLIFKGNKGEVKFKKD